MKYSVIPEIVELLIESKPLGPEEVQPLGLIYTSIEGTRHRVYPLLGEYFVDFQEKIPEGYVYHKAVREVAQSSSHIAGWVDPEPKRQFKKESGTYQVFRGCKSTFIARKTGT